MSPATAQILGAEQCLQGALAVLCQSRVRMEQLLAQLISPSLYFYIPTLYIGTCVCTCVETYPCPWLCLPGRAELCSCSSQHSQAAALSPRRGAETAVSPLGRCESLPWLSTAQGIALPRLAGQECRDSQLPNGWGMALQSCRVPTPCWTPLKGSSKNVHIAFLRTCGSA